MRPDAAVPDFLAPFSDPEAVKHYAEGPRRFVPGFADLHRMTGILLAEHAAPDARLLVLGAGGGLELKALAETQPGWTFVGVDPAAEMLKLAERTLGPLASRAKLQQGYIDDAPDGPFDAASALIVGQGQRLPKPGPPCLVEGVGKQRQHPRADYPALAGPYLRQQDLGQIVINCCVRYLGGLCDRQP